jgi:hypothetical protein
MVSFSKGIRHLTCKFRSFQVWNQNGVTSFELTGYEIRVFLGECKDLKITFHLIVSKLAFINKKKIINQK